VNKKIIELKNLIDKAKHIVFFGGAGVSTESNIMDFRSKKGLYNLKSKYGKPYEEMLSSSYFYSDTATFYSFYKEFMIKKDAKSNYAHKYLAKLEKSKDLTIITQNIDGLHTIAGSKNVIELHGSIYRNYCLNCGKSFSLDYITSFSDVPHCDKCNGIIKPDVVLYEEPLLDSVITKAIIALTKADLLIIAGTSLNVYPASGLINYFYGNNIVLINKEKQAINKDIKLFIEGKIGEIFSLVDSIK